MNESMQYVLTCPVCMNLLQTPVMLLPCQHNLCKKCLREICDRSSIANCCPVCRRSFLLGTKGVDGFSRNLLIEQLIEEHNSEKKVSKEPKKMIQSRTNNRDLVVKYTPDRRPPRPPPPKADAPTKSAPKPTVDLVSYFHDLQGKVDVVKLLIAQEKYAAAARTADQVASMAVDLPLGDHHTELGSWEVRDLGKEMCRKGETQAAISLLYAASKLCQRIPDADKKLSELMFVAEAMQPVSIALADTERVTQFKQHGLPVLADVVQAMEHVACADRVSKTVKQAWCFKYVSACCRNIGEHEQSLERDRRAIDLMDARFGSAAATHRVYGVCCHNLATTYRKLSRFKEAEKAYFKAIESFRVATDWPNEERMRKSIMLSSAGLNEIQKDLTRS